MISHKFEITLAPNIIDNPKIRRCCGRLSMQCIIIGIRIILTEIPERKDDALANVLLFVRWTAGQAMYNNTAMANWSEVLIL